MKKSSIEKRIPRFITIGLVILLFVAVLFLMQHVQKLLYLDTQINLAEIVTQNKDVISSKLAVEVNNIEGISSQISDRLKQKASVNDDTLKEVFYEYGAGNPNVEIFMATPNGKAYQKNGEIVDVLGRKYFRLAMEGNPNVSDRMVSRGTGDDVFVISVPIYNKDTVVGTLQKQYTSEKMYGLCALSLFSDQGSMSIINSDGYIMVTSEDLKTQSSDNYYRILSQQGNQDASKKIEENIKENQSGFIETILGGEKMFSAYTPLEGLHDWYLISGVATDAISTNTKTVINLFYIILFVVVLSVGGILTYIFAYKKKQQTALQEIAFVDAVTGGDTYNKFTVDLQDAIKENPEKQYYLLMFDIDNFKYVNNFYGFDIGDQILRRINQIMRENLGYDESIARVSGDHFVVRLTDASRGRMSNILKEAMCNDKGITLYYTAGVYAITDRTESVNLMVDKAAAAAGNSKGMLRKEIEFYSSKYEEKMIYNEQLKRSVVYALQNDEMIPYYQPKVNVNTGNLVGAEALARWRKQDGRLVVPFEFLPMCEKTGLVVELDMIIFEKTLKFLKRNLEKNIVCVPISVNFSRLHLLNDGFIEKVIELIDNYAIPPELIEIELTESAIFDNHEIISEFTNQLHKYGLQISMDDFGSGYSSLNMLKDIPIDVLKIDRGFLEETSNSDKQRIILSTIASMANQLNIKVVVEGVETLENVNLMKEFGCYIAQGYYFARPMEESAFEVIYEEGMLSQED